MTTALATRPQNQQLEQAAEQVRTLSGYLRAREAKLSEVLPRHMAKLMPADRMIRIVVSAASRNPKLLECTPETVYVELHKAAQLGLEAQGPLGHFYLVPRWNGKLNRRECTSIIGYKGLAELCRRSGEIARIDAVVVYDGEEFRVTRGLRPDVHHVFDITVSRADDRIVAAYAVVETKSGGSYFEVLTRPQIEARRARNTMKGDSPWDTDYAAMCRKTALRALLAGGLVPLSSELATALELDAAAELPDAADLPVDVPPAEPTPEPPAAAEPPRTQQAAAEIKRRGRPRKTEQQQQPEARAPSSAPSPEDEDAFAVPDDAPPDAPPAAADAAPSTAALALKALNLVEDGRATGWLSPQNAAQWNGWLAAHKNSAESMQNAVTKLTEQLAKAAAAPQDQPA